METLLHVPEEIKERMTEFLQGERDKALKQAEAFAKAISDLVSNNVVPNVVVNVPKSNNSTDGNNAIKNTRGTVGWKFKIDDVLPLEESQSISANEVVDRISELNPGINKKVAIKSVGSTLSQNSSNISPEKNRFLFIKKNGIKYYYKNKQNLDE